MSLTTRLTVLASLLLGLSACARSSADGARSEVPGTPEPIRANNENVGLEPLGDPVDTVGSSENMTPTDGAAPVKPGTEDTGNPGGGTVNPVGSSPPK
jgi:hypothetical protein